MKQPRRRPPKHFRAKKSAPGGSAKKAQERSNELPAKETVMTSISTINHVLDGYEFAAWAELSPGPAGETVTVSTNWDKESISFPTANLGAVIDALQSLKHELTGKRG